MARRRRLHRSSEAPGSGRASGRSRGTVLRTLNPFDFEGRKRSAIELRQRDEQPYRYESNGITVRWITVALLAWIALVLVVAYSDWNQARVLDRWENQGFETVPPSLSAPFTEADLEALVAFSRRNHAGCESIPELVESVGGCNQVLDFSAEINDAEFVATSSFAGLLILFVVAAVLIGGFAHQANRNLLTLKSEGARFSSTSAMMWLYVPFINFYKGAQIFDEIWKASDPEASTTETTEWKRRATSWLIPLWWLSFAAALVFSPRTIRTLTAAETIEEHIAATRLIILSDLLLILPAILAVVVIRRVHDRQGKRRQKVGDYLAVPASRSED